MLGDEQSKLFDARIENLVEELDRAKSEAAKLLVEFRKAMSDRNTLEKKLETRDLPPETK